jgi:hypothetical protein
LAYSINFAGIGRALESIRCDASNQACGGTLLQEHVDPVTEAKELQVIAFVSTKFSGSAALWPTNKKECHSLYYSVKELSYYLQCKEFFLQTDHYNLLYMEQSTQSVLQRWRLYLQSYSFQLQHIQGKASIFADYLSRMYHIYASEVDFDPTLPITTQDRVARIMSPTASSLSKTPLEWNLILMGDQDHLAVLPPMSEPHLQP